jgi:hypothetical protein
MLRAILSLALVLSGAHGQTSSKRQTPAGGRQRPPRAVECPRDHLTSYTGKLTSYNRSRGQLQIRIRTDWDTDEEFTLRFAEGESPTSRFLLRSNTFQSGDWKAIESTQGRLRPGVRATVWECKGDGRPQLTIDWLPPPDSQRN